MKIPGPGPDRVWEHVRRGDEPVVQRNTYGDELVHISIESNCDWEPEHGLQPVFREGRAVTKVGPYDGHLPHTDARADPASRDVVYRRLT